MKQSSKLNLSELAQSMTLLNEEEQKSLMGGWYIDDKTHQKVYHQYEYDTLHSLNFWEGGFVEDSGYISKDVIITPHKVVSTLLEQHQDWLVEPRKQEILYENYFREISKRGNNVHPLLRDSEFYKWLRKRKRTLDGGGGVSGGYVSFDLAKKESNNTKESTNETNNANLISPPASIGWGNEFGQGIREEGLSISRKNPFWTKKGPLYRHESEYEHKGRTCTADDGVIIAFPEYMVDTETKLGKMPLGHAGVLLIDNKNGITKYYEYGRYDKENKGIVRSFTIPNVVIGSDGKPTQESLIKVFKIISKNSGKGGDINAAYISSSHFDRMNNYAKKRMAENKDPHRDEYFILNRNCATFTLDVIFQDENVERPYFIIKKTPENIVEEMQEEGYLKIYYDAEQETIREKE